MSNLLNIVNNENTTNSKMAVDHLITAIEGDWKFDEQVTQSFDDHVVKSVPFYEEFQRMVVEISEWFVRDNALVYDIGSSTGTTISLLNKRHQGKQNIKFYGIEESESMVENARAKCNSSNVNFLHQDVIDTPCIARASFVTSILTMQFLPLDQRAQVFKRIYEGLIQGGAFVMVEKVLAENSFIESLWSQLYWDYKQRQGLSDSMILQKAKSLRGVLNPLTLNQNIELLKNAGFVNTAIFFKWYNFVGIIAVKEN